MGDTPYPITSKDPAQAINQMRQLIDELYQERIAGALVGDVFTVGEDDILTLGVSSSGGLEKSASELAVKLKATGGLGSSVDGLYLNVAAKGDLLAGTADNVVAILPVGTAGQVLTSGGAGATGLVWSDTPTFGDIVSENATGGVLYLERDDLTVSNTDYIGTISWLAKDTDVSGGVYQAVANITVEAAEDFDDANDAGVTMSFWVNQIGAETPNIEMQLSGETLKVDHLAELTTDHGIAIGNEMVVSGYVSCDNFTDSAHYTGFPNRTDTSISWADGTYTLTLTATSDPIWINGVEYIINTLTKQLTVAQEAATGLYWFWLALSAGSPILFCDTVQPGFDKCLVATVYWNTTTSKGILSDERHWFGRDRWFHEYLHQTVGARYASGMAGTFADATFQVDSGEFYDEDFEHTNGNITTAKILYHNGDADWAWDILTTPYKVVNPGADNNLRYNNVNALATVDNNKYVNSWVFITGDTVHPVHIVIGTAQYTTLALARAASLPSLGSLASAESKLIYKVTYQNNGGTPDYIETTDYRASSNLPSTAYVATDHGSLAGLSDDDHPQYLLITGTRAMSGSLTIGVGLADTDYNITFDGETTNGIVTWMEDEDYFQFADGILIPTGEQIYFRDTAIAVQSTDDGWLNLVADVGVEVNAPILNVATFYDAGKITLTSTEAPTADPGWAASSTIDMTAPDVYLKIYVGAQAYSIPGWIT